MIGSNDALHAIPISKLTVTPEILADKLMFLKRG